MRHPAETGLTEVLEDEGMVRIQQWRLYGSLHQLPQAKKLESWGNKEGERGRCQEHQTFSSFELHRLVKELAST